LLRAIAHAFRFAVLVFLVAASAPVAAGAEPLALVPAGVAPHVGPRPPGDGTTSCPCTLFGDTAPGRASADDANAVELGVRFRSDVGYAFDEQFFAKGGVDRGPLHAAGPNGVFHYGTSEFPEQTHEAANYRVDVVFTTAPAPEEAEVGPPPAPAGVRLTIPAGDTLLPGSLTIGVDASDPTGLRSVTLYANGIRINTFTCSGPTCTGAFAWITDRYLPPGSHTLFAVATNAEGVHHRSATVTITR